jgi:hypothetical protein
MMVAWAPLPTSAEVSPVQDRRIVVKMPERLITQFKGAMRAYLETLGQIQADMGAGDFVAASTTAEETLGRTAHKRVLALRPETLNYISPNMRAIGDSLHESASLFAVEVKRTANTGDSGPAWTAMSHIISSCAACHAGYRLVASDK